MKRNIKPHYLFLILVAIFVTLSFLCSNDALDINIQDTYFVVGYYQMLLLIAFYFAIISGIYGLIEKRKTTSIQLVRIHWVLSSITTLVPVSLLFDKNNFSLFNYFLPHCGIFHLIGILTFIFNIIYTLIKK